jgi:hypothetical protein
LRVETDEDISDLFDDLETGFDENESLCCVQFRLKWACPADKVERQAAFLRHVEYCAARNLVDVLYDRVCDDILPAPSMLEWFAGANREGHLFQVLCFSLRRLLECRSSEKRGLLAE